MVKQQYWKECCTIPCPSKYFNASNGLYVLLLILTLIKLVIDMKKFTIVSTIGLEIFLMQWHLWNRTK
jgi:hypothetical protein